MNEPRVHEDGPVKAILQLESAVLVRTEQLQPGYSAVACDIYNNGEVTGVALFIPGASVMEVCGPLNLVGGTA